MRKIAFVGVGSIAVRHIKNLAEIFIQRNEKFQIDVFRHIKREIEDTSAKVFVSNVYSEDELYDKQYDIIFITNPTALHFETIKKCVSYSKHMFIEKPVFDNCGENINNLNLQESSVYYVACPLRYTTVLQYIIENIDMNEVYSARAISTSYLPDWRPGTDYRNTYSAHKNLGGGVAVDLIHEWDYLTELFGMPRHVYYSGGKFSHLEIDSDDLAVYIGVYDKLLVELHLDYFGRSVERKLTLYMRDEVIEADIENSRITYLVSGKIIHLPEDRDEYQKRELLHFLDIVDGKCSNDNSVKHALDVLKIAKNYTMEVE